MLIGHSIYIYIYFLKKVVTISTLTQKRYYQASNYFIFGTNCCLNFHLNSEEDFLTQLPAFVLFPNIGLLYGLYDTSGVLCYVLPQVTHDLKFLFHLPCAQVISILETVMCFFAVTMYLLNSLKGMKKKRSP